jgi:ABC-type multidrug transport system fused ATPase/permease subunit
MNESVRTGIDVVVPQQAWVQSGNIRENITFSSGSEDFDQQRVDDVIHACGLQADIDKWQDGVL